MACWQRPNQTLNLMLRTRNYRQRQKNKTKLQNASNSLSQQPRQLQQGSADLGIGVQSTRPPQTLKFMLECSTSGSPYEPGRSVFPPLWRFRGKEVFDKSQACITPKRKRSHLWMRNTETNVLQQMQPDSLRAAVSRAPENLVRHDSSFSCYRQATYHLIGGQPGGLASEDDLSDLGPSGNGD